VSEAGVKAAVQCCDKYMNAMRRYFDLAEVVELLKVAVRTMDMKKRMLENLTTLHGQQYFAGPSTPKNLVEAWALYSQKSEGRVNDKQRSGARRRVPGSLNKRALSGCNPFLPHRHCGALHRRPAGDPRNSSKY
jgi:hypothetical protein